MKARPRSRPGFCLRPIAFASPPDQSWLGGFFDDADYDDVIVLLTGATPATASVHFACDPRPTLVVVAAVVDIVDTPAFATLSVHYTRAPPRPLAALPPANRERPLPTDACRAHPYMCTKGTQVSSALQRMPCEVLKRDGADTTQRGSRPPGLLGG